MVHTHYRVRGGEDEAVRREVSLLARHGQDVTTLLFANAGSPLESSLALLRSARNRVSEERLAETIGNFAPDLVHFHNVWFRGSYSLPSVARSMGVPVVSSLHNFRHICASGDFFRDGSPCTDCLTGSSISAVKHRCYRSSAIGSAIAARNVVKGQRGVVVAEVSDRLLVLSSKAISLYLQAGVPSSKIVKVNNFVEEPPTRMGRPSESKTYLFVGRDSPEKGLSLLLDAWRIFVTGYPNYRLLLAGVGGERAFPPGVRALGTLSRDRVTELMLSARGLVFPSICFENQPLVVLEAFAAGIPVVTHMGNSAAEIVGPAWAGKVVPLAQPSDFAIALADLTHDRTVNELGTNARQAYFASYTPKVKIAELEALYQGVIDETGAMGHVQSC